MTKNEALALRGQIIALKRDSTQIAGRLLQISRLKDIDSEIYSALTDAAGDAADLCNKLDISLEQINETLR